MRSLVQILRGWYRALHLTPPEPTKDQPSGNLAQPVLDRPRLVLPTVAWHLMGNRYQHQAWARLALLLYSGRAPVGLTVEHSLSLAKLRLRSLPDRLTVGGDLDLRQCQRLARLGDHLDVAGDLQVGGRCHEAPWWEEAFLADSAPGEPALAAALRILSRDGQCPLVELPPGLRVGGDLWLRQCRRLVRVSDDLVVGESIHLEGCTALAALPDPWVVSGDLSITSAPSLTKLPVRLEVRGKLRLVGVSIEQLPEGLQVGGDLHLECCPRLTSLPAGLNVGGSLIVRRCPIDRLPEGLRVGGDLTLHRLPQLIDLPVGLAVPGRVELVGCPELLRIAPGIRVGTDLLIRRCEGLRELPAGLHVPGTLDLRGCTGLEVLPSGLDLGSTLGETPFLPALRLADCPAVRSLPEDLKVSGPIEVAGSGLHDLPERLMASVRLLWRGVVVPPEVVFRPETLSPDQILGQPNAELRRVMLERVGLDRVLRQAGAEVVDRDHDAGGERRLVRMSLRPTERQTPPWWGWLAQTGPHCYLHCRCPSTGREYLLRVPPETRTCRHAAAWLAGFDDPADYRPVVET